MFVVKLFDDGSRILAFEKGDTVTLECDHIDDWSKIVTKKGTKLVITSLDRPNFVACNRKYSIAWYFVETLEGKNLGRMPVWYFDTINVGKL